MSSRPPARRLINRRHHDAASSLPAKREVVRGEVRGQQRTIERELSALQQAGVPSTPRTTRRSALGGQSKLGLNGLRVSEPCDCRRLPIAHRQSTLMCSSSAKTRPGVALAKGWRTSRTADRIVAGASGQRARWSRSASSRSAWSSVVIRPTRRPMRSTAIERTCSACALESTASPVASAGSST